MNKKHLKHIGLAISICGFGLFSCTNEDFIEAAPVSKGELVDGELNGEKVFVTVENSPEFKGGIPELYKYIGENITYPKGAKERGIEGRVFVRFVVDKNGDVIAPKILKGISDDIDQEAIRVISESPKWEPGKQGGQPVNTFFTMPIVFRLE